MQLWLCGGLFLASFLGFLKLFRTSEFPHTPGAYSFSSNRTFEEVAQEIYGHPRMWPLVYHSCKTTRPNSNQYWWRYSPQQVIPANWSITFIDVDKCYEYMSTTCVQISAYLQQGKRYPLYVWDDNYPQFHVATGYPYYETLPGDTYKSVSRKLYGSEKYWFFIWSKTIAKSSHAIAGTTGDAVMPPALVIVYPKEKAIEQWTEYYSWRAPVGNDSPHEEIIV